MFTLQRFTLVFAVAFLILGLHSNAQFQAVSAAVFAPKHDDRHAEMAFTTYDFNQNKAIEKDEFTAFLLTTFAEDEKRYLKPKTVEKLFEYLDIVGDGKLDGEEFRKAFQRWYTPIIAAKSCLFLCVPQGVTNTSELELKTSQLIELSQAFFKIHYVFVSACHDENRSEPISLLVEHVQKMLPKAYDIKLYSAHSHLNALKNKDFDQLIVHLSNIKHDNSALKGLMSHNSAHQHPTIVVAREDERSELSKYLDSEHLHSAIFVNPSLDARDRANYKSELALILARKIFRKYKKY